MEQPGRTATMIAAMVLTTLLAGGTFEGVSAQLPTNVQVLSVITKVNNYWISQNPHPGDNEWQQATYFLGDLAAYDATNQANYLSYALTWAKRNKYSLYSGNTTTFADNQAAGQPYIRLYQLSGHSSDIAGITKSVNGMVKNNVYNVWTWIDAINMSAPNFAELGAIYANPAYFAQMYDLYSYTRDTLGLWDHTAGLWWRDASYINTSFWSRGNGWVFAALAKVLAVLPSTDPHYAEYLSDFTAMAKALASCQQSGGYWNSDLLGNSYVGPESSGTSFFLFGFAWALNNHIWDTNPGLVLTCQEVVANAWNFLANTAVQPSGLLGYVQASADAPGPTTSTTTYDFGVGAFLLAAHQMSVLTGGK